MQERPKLIRSPEGRPSRSQGHSGTPQAPGQLATTSKPRQGRPSGHFGQHVHRSHSPPPEQILRKKPAFSWQFGKSHLTLYCRAVHKERSDSSLLRVL
jgi:hypothetical protein